MFCMQEGSSSVDEPPASPPLQQPASVFADITTPAPSSSATTGMESVGTLDSDDNDDATGPPEEMPERENETQQEAKVADGAPGEEPEQPQTPERSAQPVRTTEHARADDTAAQAEVDVGTIKPDGRATLPATPAHDSEGSDAQSARDHGRSPHKDRKPRLQASKLRLLAFRSFSRDKKGKKSGDAAGEEASAEHEDKGKEGKEGQRRFWK